MAFLLTLCLSVEWHNLENMNYSYYKDDLQRGQRFAEEEEKHLWFYDPQVTIFIFTQSF